MNKRNELTTQKVYFCIVLSLLVFRNNLLTVRYSKKGEGEHLNCEEQNRRLRTKRSSGRVVCVLYYFIRRLFMAGRGLQTDVVYLGWPIAPSYMSPNAGEGGGELRSLSQWVQLCTWSPNKLWRSNSIFNLWFMKIFWICTYTLTVSVPSRNISYPPVSVRSTDPSFWGLSIYVILGVFFNPEKYTMQLCSHLKLSKKSLCGIWKDLMVFFTYLPLI